MPEPRKTVELNEPTQPQKSPAEFAQHLISASNELYLFELKCIQNGRTVPETLKRAHAALRAELKRLAAEEAASGE